MTMLHLFDYDDSVKFLNDYLVFGKAKNRNYSLRSLARQTGIAPSTLSGLINRKASMTVRMAQVLVKKLRFEPLEQEYFLDLVRIKRSSDDPNKRDIIQKRLLQNRFELQAQHLSEEWLIAIKEWYHMAIIELTNVKGFSSDPAWIADKLGLDEIQVIPAIQRLKKLKLLTEENGTLKAGLGIATTSQAVPSDVIKRMHAQFFQLGQKSLYQHDLNQRDNSFMVFAMDSRELSQLRDVLQSFRRDFAAERIKSESKDRVYCLAINLFPLSN